VFIDDLQPIAAYKQPWTQAAEHFEGAIAIYDEVQDRHHAARVRRHYAEALLRQGEIQQVRELLATALAVFEDLDLPQEVLATRQWLEETGEG